MPAPEDHTIPIRQAELACAVESGCGEGPLWLDRKAMLNWVDIDGCRLNSLDPLTAKTGSVSFDESVCAIVETTSDLRLLALAKRMVLINHSGDIIEDLCEIESDRPNNRCNDGKVDPAGRLWIGTMHNEGMAGEGSLYRLDHQNNQPVRMLDGLSIANGLAWSRDSRTFFYIDSPTREIWAFDFDPANSSISNRRTVVHVPDTMGIPDGMSIDTNDRLWVAHWGDGMVRCWDPRDGSHLASIQIQDKLSTSCTFGGANRDTLYITSGSDSNNTSVSSGRLYQIQMSIQGEFSFQYRLN